MKKHLFLTGEKQVGKSTLIEKLLIGKEKNLCGFQTKPLMIGKEKKGYYFYQYNFGKEPQNNPPCIISLGEDKMVAVNEVFDTLGVEILLTGLENKEKPIMVLDELGRLEKGCSNFIKAVEKCLDEKEQIIGVVQKGAKTYEEIIKKHPRVLLVEVTDKNREDLLKDLYKVL